jgi:hypothetical protein
MAKKKKGGGTAKTEADLLKSEEARRKYAEMQLVRRKVGITYLSIPQHLL